MNAQVHAGSPATAVDSITPSTPVDTQGVARKRRGRPTREEAQAKQERAQQSDFLVGCDSKERAWAVSLIRLLRTNYWLTHFVKNVLRLDSSTPHQVTIAAVEQQMKSQKNIEELAMMLQHIGKTGWYADHPVIKAVADEWGDDGYSYRGDEAVKQLIESAKKAAQR